MRKLKYRCRVCHYYKWKFLLIFKAKAKNWDFFISIFFLTDQPTLAFKLKKKTMLPEIKLFWPKHILNMFFQISVGHFLRFIQTNQKLTSSRQELREWWKDMLPQILSTKNIWIYMLLTVKTNRNTVRDFFSFFIKTSNGYKNRLRKIQLMIIGTRCSKIIF